PMIAFGWVTNMLQRGMASWKRMLEILDTTPAIADAAAVRLKIAAAPDTAGTSESIVSVASGFSRTVIPVRGEIEFRDVTFAYGNAAPVLEHVSARIEPGQTVRLVGATGSGKSTLILLIARL